jgi:hypothetical protein
VLGGGKKPVGDFDGRGFGVPNPLSDQVTFGSFTFSYMRR